MSPEEMSTALEETVLFALAIGGGLLLSVVVVAVILRKLAVQLKDLGKDLNALNERVKKIGTVLAETKEEREERERKESERRAEDKRKAEELEEEQQRRPYVPSPKPRENPAVTGRCPKCNSTAIDPKSCYCSICGAEWLPDYW